MSFLRFNFQFTGLVFHKTRNIYRMYKSIRAMIPAINMYEIMSTQVRLDLCEIKYYYATISDRDNVGILASSYNIQLTDDQGVVVRRLLTDDEVRRYYTEVKSHQEILYLDDSNHFQLRDRFSTWNSNQKIWVRDESKYEEEHKSKLIQEVNCRLSKTLTDSHRRWNKLSSQQRTEQEEYLVILRNIIDHPSNQMLPDEPSFINEILNQQEERIVAFIDLLGFSASVTNTSKTPEQLKNIREILERFQDMVTNYNIAVERVTNGMDLFCPTPTISAFSDSIVISYPCAEMCISKKLTILGSLNNLIVDIARFVLERGFIIRGGIAQGALYHERGCIFGEALIEAHELETKCAFYPRIILSEKFAVEMALDTSDSCHNLHIKDLDGWYVLNYIIPLCIFSVWQKKYSQLIEVIKENINSLETKKKYKWEWLLSQTERYEQSLSGTLLIKHHGV